MASSRPKWPYGHMDQCQQCHYFLFPAPVSLLHYPTHLVECIGVIKFYVSPMNGSSYSARFWLKLTSSLPQAMAHGTKQVDCLCKWLCRWPPPTNFILKHELSASKYIFMWIWLSYGMFECWSCVFGQYWVIFIFTPFSHIWPVPTVKPLSHMIHAFYSVLKGVNGSNHTDIEHFILDSGTHNMTFLYLMLSGDKEH